MKAEKSPQASRKSAPASPIPLREMLPSPVLRSLKTAPSPRRPRAKPLQRRAARPKNPAIPEKKAARSPIIRESPKQSPQGIIIPNSKKKLSDLS